MCSPCLCPLCTSASIHPPIPTFGKFLLEIFLNFLFLLFLLRGAAHALAVDVSSAHMHWQNGVQQLVHSVLTIEKRWSYVAVNLCSKQSAKPPSPENSLATGGCFECNTFLVMVLDWLKKERMKERKKERWTILIFGHFRFAPLKLLLYIAITTIDWNKPLKLLSVFLDASICSSAMISLCKC